MARIRTVKPEFYSSPGIETLSFEWRLLYIAMWNWADDTGRGTAEARELMGFAFPLDEEMTIAEFRRGLGEVRRVFGVKFYKVSGRSYYYIPAWDKHQKIDKRSGSRWPAPEDGAPYDPVSNSAPTQGISSHSEKPAECPPSIRSELDAGTGEQGNRGTEEQRKKTCPAKPNATPQPDEFLDWYLEYPRKESKGVAEKAYAKARKLATAEELVEGAIRYREDPNREPSFTKLPATWLNGKCWEDGPLPERNAPQSRPTGSQVRLQAGLELMQRAQAKQERQTQAQAQFEIEG